VKSGLTNHKNRVVLLRAKHQANLAAVRMILRAWLDHPEESFSFKEVQFEAFCLPLKTSCPHC